MRFLLAPALLLGLPSAALALPPDASAHASSSVLAELLTLEQQVGRASNEHDRATLESLIAPEFVQITPTGRVYRRAEIIALWTRNDPAITGVTHDIAEPRVYPSGDTVIFSAVTTDSWHQDGRIHTYRERVFDVWQRRAGRWRFIAGTSTKLTD